MKIYDELVARGLIAQVTDEAEIKELVNNGQATFYIGFDPTADSLHVGHFMALCLMKRLQMAGNKPVVLIGGGTAMIGDPSGRTDMRQMMTRETIQHNCDCFKRQMERFIEFGEDKAIMPLEESDFEIMEILKDKKAVVLLNKSDLEVMTSKSDVKEHLDKTIIAISAKENTGITELEDCIKDMFFQGEVSFNDEIYITNIRQKNSLQDALDSLNLVVQSIEDCMPEDFYSIDLMNAYESLGRMIGESVEDDLVNEIFSKFCMTLSSRRKMPMT